MNENVKAGLANVQRKAMVAAGSLVAMGAANAADPDISAVTAAAASVAVIGAAVFAVHVGIKLWGWLRRAA